MRGIIGLVFWSTVGLVPVATGLVIASVAAAGEPPGRFEQAGVPPSAANASATGSVSGTVTVRDNERVVEDVEVVLYIVGPRRDEDVPPTTIEMVANDELNFIPELAVITVGDSVEFPNRGRKVHDVFSRKPRFELGLRAGESKTRRFTERGVVEVYCNLHPTEAATIIVAPNRHHTRTDDGTFRIDDVPVGEWELFAYTRRAIKPTRTKISVTPKGVVVDLSIARGVAGAKPGSH